MINTRADRTMRINTTHPKSNQTKKDPFPMILGKITNKAAIQKKVNSIGRGIQAMNGIGCLPNSW